MSPLLFGVAEATIALANKAIPNTKIFILYTYLINLEIGGGKIVQIGKETYEGCISSASVAFSSIN